MQFCERQTNLGVVGKRGGEKLDTSFRHCMCSRNNIVRVQPDVLDPWRPVLLQEGVHLIPAWNESKRTVTQELYYHQIWQDLITLSKMGAAAVSHLAQAEILQWQTCSRPLFRPQTGGRCPLCCTSSTPWRWAVDQCPPGLWQSLRPHLHYCSEKQTNSHL